MPASNPPSEEDEDFSCSPQEGSSSNSDSTNSSNCEPSSDSIVRRVYVKKDDQTGLLEKKELDGLEKSQLKPFCKIGYMRVLYLARVRATKRETDRQSCLLLLLLYNGVRVILECLAFCCM